jgi:hypothetical protein
MYSVLRIVLRSVTGGTVRFTWHQVTPGPVTAADGEDSPTERRRLMLILVRYGYDMDMIWLVNVSKII